MTLADKIIALLDSLTPEQLFSMVPLDRRRLMNSCQRVLLEATLQEAAAAKKPRTGIRKRLEKGERSE